MRSSGADHSFERTISAANDPQRHFPGEAQQNMLPDDKSRLRSHSTFALTGFRPRSRQKSPEALQGRLQHGAVGGIAEADRTLPAGPKGYAGREADASLLQ